MANILIIDDDKQICSLFEYIIQREGHQSVCAFSIEQGLNAAAEQKFDIVFLDVNLPDGDGLEILPKIRNREPAPEVIIITGAGDGNGAEIAIQNGAWDYLQKPLSNKEVMLSLKRIFQYRDELTRVEKKPVALKLEGYVGTSALMTSYLDTVAQAADCDASALITGETGTGKELCAKLIHNNSARADRNFVVVDCASLHATLVESTLFGFEKGAFTGAEAAREGLIKQADGGTLFLDEIGELSLDHQKAFLRVLQEKKFRVIGSKKEMKSDFRLLAATNRDLDQMVSKGAFRKDLLFRLKAIHIDVPPLRAHPDDIEALTTYYMKEIYHKLDLDMKGYSPEFLEALCAYAWPGNIRELINTLEGVISAARSDATLFPKHLPDYIRIKIAKARISPGKSKSGQEPEITADKINSQESAIPLYSGYRQQIMAEADVQYFKKLMAASKGSIKDACKMSGLGRTRLYTQLKKYGISRMGWPAG